MVSPTQTITTAEQLLAAGDIGRCEIVRGELKMMTLAGSEHGEIALKLGILIGSHVRLNDLGRTFAAETGFIIRRNPDTVRAPDVSFVKASRIPAGRLAGYFPGAPDLVVEVLSPSDAMGDVLAKINDWLDAGSVQVWVVDPQTRTLSVYEHDRRTARIFREGDVYDAAPLLPGLTVGVNQIFE